jgi:hypothetical protein
VTPAAVAADRDLLAIYDFTVLVSASARSARQHDRIVRAVGAPISGSGLLALRVVERHGPIAGSGAGSRSTSRRRADTSARSKGSAS